MVYNIGVGLGGREGGLRQGFLGVLLGGQWSSFARGKMLSNIQRFQEIFKKKKQVLTFIEIINMHTMPNL